jgi:UDP-2-acetamido-2,6-beta-L-arabino-hexul-4-ose reductase
LENEAMPQVALTGANGFLGWHTRCAARAHGQSSRPIRLGDSFDATATREVVGQADVLIHIAGVNRGSAEDIIDGNVSFAHQIGSSLRQTDRSPTVVVFANSIQAGSGTAYGKSKYDAARIVEEAAHAVGAEFRDVILPNLYGEHGRPFYNSVVATFCHLLAEGQQPEIVDDKELVLMHAQDAADLLLGNTPTRGAITHTSTVGQLLTKLKKFADQYSDGDIPDISNDFDRNLFNTYRSYVSLLRPGVPLLRHADERGSFFEVTRTHGGSGQTSFSTTVPGVTRGEHFHRRKVERFTVLAGQAIVRLRRMFTDEIIEVPARGDLPIAIDMPTLWAHSITNVGNDELFTSFWSNELFDPLSPDTFAEIV